jgi:predicted DNA-binding transcriptional regulator AlpA
MKKITDLKEGDLLMAEDAARLFGISKKRLYEWNSKSKSEPNKYPRGVKIGGMLFFLKSSLIEHLNREFSKAS